MNRNTGEVALAQKLVEFSCAEGALDEDDDLVELQLVKEIVELAVLLALADLDVVLLKTVKSELVLVVDEDFEGVLHELLADWSGVLREGC